MSNDQFWLIAAVATTPIVAAFAVFGGLARISARSLGIFASLALLATVFLSLAAADGSRCGVAELLVLSEECDPSFWLKRAIRIGYSLFGLFLSAALLLRLRGAEESKAL